MIALEHLYCRAGDFQLADINLSIAAGQYGVLMGPTGCGKTTLLEMMCGLRHPDQGRVFINGNDVTALPPGHRGIGYVPQDAALFPTMPVAEQIGFALRVRRRPADEIRARVETLAAQLSLTHLLHRLPQDLSGGERQRVALGRSLAAQPSVLLLDEPLSALDESTREEMAALLRQTQRRHALTVLHVTHSRQEAARLADTLFRLEAGRVQETPLTALQGG
ncbi:MAG: ABC transporter ATP-binding protein [Pedosphaera sp.]|nr:ABC transporter ATP-binding protein [Pedosphaera sp.]